MPQYDGSIRVNTEIESKNVTSQMLKIINTMKQAEEEITRLKGKMESLKNAKIPTYEYKELQNELKKAETHADSLYGKLRVMEKTGVDRTSASFTKLREEIRQVDRFVDELRAGMSQMESSGKAFVSGVNTDEYAKMAAKVNQLNGNIDVSKLKLSELQAKQRPISEEFDNVGKAAKGALSSISAGTQKSTEFLSVLSRVQRSVSGVGKVLGNIGKFAGNAFRTAKTAAQKLFSSINIGAKKSNGLLSTFASRLKGMALSLLIFNWISKGFNAMVSGMKTGFTNLMNYSSTYAESVQSLKNAMSTLGNSFAAAFAPIVQMVIPYLVQLINWINAAVSAVAQMIAVLTGKSSFIRAKQVQDSYNKSLGETASAAKKAYGALAKFDDLDVLQKQEDTDVGSAGANGAAGDMFEEVPVDDKWKNIAEWFKEMWENSDFYALGKLLGEKLKEALDSIPWDEIKETARKIGKSIATLINGFIEVEGLGYSIGKTLVEAINTGFEFLNSFVHELHWESIGTFIAETINGFFENIDWQLIYNTFITGVKGLGDAINSFADSLNWDAISTAIANGFNTLIDTIYIFFTTIDFAELGQIFGEQVTKILEGIDWEQASATFSEVAHSFLEFLINALQTLDWGVVGESIRDLLMGIDWSTMLKDVADLMSEALSGAVQAAFVAFGGDSNWLEEWQAGNRQKREHEQAEMALFYETLKMLATNFVTSFMETMGQINTIFTELEEYLSGVFATMWQSTWETAQSIYQEFRNVLDTASAAIKELFSGLFKSVKLLVNGDWKGAWDNAKKVFDTFKEKVVGIVDKVRGILDSFFSWVSEMISSVLSAIGSIGSAISGAASSFGNFVGGIFGGGSGGGDGTSFSLDSVPALASGSVIRGGNPFLAILGDQPSGQTNVEAPLSTIRQAVRDELSGMSFGSGAPSTIVLNVDGQEFARLTMDNWMAEAARQGYDVEILGAT